MDLIHDVYGNGLSKKLPRDQLFTMLAARLRGVRYSEREVQDAINLMTHPAFACAIGESESGIALAMNRHTFTSALRGLADLVDTNYEEE